MKIVRHFNKDMQVRMLMSRTTNYLRQQRNPTASWAAERSMPQELPQQQGFDQHHRHFDH
jgi:hypothetical protein